MNIAHFTNSNIGGGNQAAIYLNKGLNLINVNSDIFCKEISKNIEEDVFKISDQKHHFPLIPRLIKKLDLFKYKPKLKEVGESRLDLFSINETQLRNVKYWEGYDVLSLHWITYMFDIVDVISDVPQSIPIVWTLHDMNAFTGGCHYSGDCLKYQNKCQGCPQIENSLLFDFALRQFEKKRKAFTKNSVSKRLTVVTPSRWLYDAAKSSELLKDFRLEHVPYGIDLGIYRPLDKSVCRDIVGLPNSSLVILFVCANLNNYRKGFDLLRDAFKHLDISDEISILTVGDGHIPLDDAIFRHIPKRSLGRLENKQLMSVAYNAADCYVVPTRADNLPLTVLESLACGTPVVGFNVGGIPDMIKPGITGEIAYTFNAEGLHDAMRKLLESLKNDNYQKKCREFAENNYSLIKQATAYKSIYKSMISNIS